MIDLTGCRIGNYVLETIYDFEPKIIQLRRESFTQPDDYYTPIELSEEWLLRLKFHADNYGIFEKFENDVNASGSKIELWVKKCLIDEKWTWDISVGQELDELVHLCYIDYLHEIQNIYFDIYKKELTIQPSKV